MNGFPRGFESIELWNWLTRPEKVLNFARMYIKYWKSMEIPKFSHLFIQILLFTADGSSADVFCIVFLE